MAFIPTAMMAYDCLWNGIYYNLDESTMTAEVTNGDSYYSGNVVIPNTIAYGNGYRVTSIGYVAFGGCTGLTSVTIPNSVTRIEDCAFSGCRGLTTVTIPNSVTYIGNAAFAGCSGLFTISVASGNSKYDSRNNCNAIIESSTNTLIAGCKNTTIPSSVTRIENYAFEGSIGLSSITIPNSVTSIGIYAFSGCSALTSVTIPASVTYIGDGAFQNCSGLTSITIPASVTYIGNGAFYRCI